MEYSHLPITKLLCIIKKKRLSINDVMLIQLGSLFLGFSWVNQTQQM